MRYFHSNSGKPSRATLKVQLILAVVMMVAIAGIAIPAMAMERDDKNTGTPLGAACNSVNMSVTKNVYNGSDFVDTYNATFGETLTFNVTISNTNNCSLTQMMVTDILSDSLTYNGTATIIHPGNGTVLREPTGGPPNYTWNLSDFASLNASDSMSISFTANVTACGTGILNTMTANATNGLITVYGNDTATVNSVQPSMTLLKEVKKSGDPSFGLSIICKNDRCHSRRHRASQVKSHQHRHLLQPDRHDDDRHTTGRPGVR